MNIEAKFNIMAITDHSHEAHCLLKDINTAATEDCSQTLLHQKTSKCLRILSEYLRISSSHPSFKFHAVLLIRNFACEVDS
jgi:hypothetical protein